MLINLCKQWVSSKRTLWAAYCLSAIWGACGPDTRMGCLDNNGHLCTCHSEARFQESDDYQDVLIFICKMSSLSWKLKHLYNNSILDTYINTTWITNRHLIQFFLQISVMKLVCSGICQLYRRYVFMMFVFLRYNVSIKIRQKYKTKLFIKMKITAKVKWPESIAQSSTKFLSWISRETVVPTAHVESYIDIETTRWKEYFSLHHKMYLWSHFELYNFRISSFKIYIRTWLLYTKSLWKKPAMWGT